MLIVTLSFKVRVGYAGANAAKRGRDVMEDDEPSQADKPGPEVPASADDAAKEVNAPREAASRPLSAIDRAALGLTANPLFVRMTEQRRALDAILAARPRFFDEFAEQQCRVSDMLAVRPTLFEEMARRQAEFDRLLGGRSIAEITAHASSVQAMIERAGGVGVLAERARAFERLLEVRPVIPDAVADQLARMGSLTSVIDRLMAPHSAIQEMLSQDLTALSAYIANATNAAGITRGVLETRFPAVVPAWRFPTATELAEVDLAAAVGAIARDATWRQAAVAEMAAIATPWVRDDAPELSIEAYAAARAITGVVSRTDPAAPRVTQLVRAELGDYREEDVVASGESDPVLVTGLRLARGFDHRFGSLSVAVVGQIFGPFGLTLDGGPEADSDLLDDLITQMARQLERRLRAFLKARMETTIGPRWIRQRVPQPIREAWEGRMQADIDVGRTPGELFDYADFSDYRIIIEKGDNWRDVFQPVFRSKIAIVETLNRLATVRNPVAHVRPMTVEDLLILRVEGRRLYVWMGEIVP